MRYNVAIVPAGQWGTALAVPIARGGHDVRLWFRCEDEANQFQRTRRHSRRLPGVTLPDNVGGTPRLAEAVADADLVVIATSSAGLEDTCAALHPLLPQKAVVLSLIKALYAQTPRFVSRYIARSLSPGGGAEGIFHRRVAVLSGPNFASEIAGELPAGTVVAAEDPGVADLVQRIVMSDRFRVWTSSDVVGVQLGGALKNVIALGAGLSDGLGMGDSARAALVTRGVAEMSRLGLALGANPLTFAGLSGIGDLMLTCTGELSRNRAAGVAIAQGASVNDYSPRQVTARRPCSPGAVGYASSTDFASRPTVEGVATTAAAYSLARELHVDMPITELVFRVLYKGLLPEVGVEQLMTRRATSELQF